MDISELEGKLDKLKALVDEASSQVGDDESLKNLLPVNIGELEGKLDDLKTVVD